MRRFAAELTLQCHFSSCFNFYLGLDSLLEMSQNQAPHSSRPSTSGKARLLRPGWSGVRLLRPARFAGRVLGILDDSPGLATSVGSATSISPLFFRTGFESPPRTSNSSNRIEMTRFVLKKKHLLAARTIVDLVPHT
jgi:hypothetical protein